MKVSPGPGWEKGDDGDFYPHLFTYADFPGARAVAIVCKGLAWLVLAGPASSQPLKLQALSTT